MGSGFNTATNIKIIEGSILDPVEIERKKTAASLKKLLKKHGTNLAAVRESSLGHLGEGGEASNRGFGEPGRSLTAGENRALGEAVALAGKIASAAGVPFGSLLGSLADLGLNSIADLQAAEGYAASLHGRGDTGATALGDDPTAKAMKDLGLVSPSLMGLMDLADRAGGDAGSGRGSTSNDTGGYSGGGNAAGGSDRGGYGGGSGVGSGGASGGGAGSGGGGTGGRGGSGAGGSGGDIR